jgi:YHS domain-containing protein
MKSVVATLVLMLGSGALLFAADTNPAAQPATHPSTQPVNKYCPISGTEEVDPDCKTVTYKGQVIGFCCEDCIPKFEKDPEKYIKNMK